MNLRIQAPEATQPPPWKTCPWCDIVLEYESGVCVKNYKGGSIPVHEYCAKQIEHDLWEKKNRKKVEDTIARIKKKEEDEEKDRKKREREKGGP